jgi:hypothetical protein
MTRELILFTLVALVLVVAVLLLVGAWRWRRATTGLLVRLEASRTAPAAARFHATELAGLPAPVQRWLGAVLVDGQPLVMAATFEHTGTFNLGEGREKWRPFTSRQRVITQRPGFLWDARIRIVPGLSVRVHDAYVAGEGVLHASMFGLISVANLSGSGDIAHGELMRYVAEAAWYPTALLPSQGVQWTAVDDDSALATLVDGTYSLTMLFRFGAGGLLTSIRAEARGRNVGDATVPTPWECRFADHEMHDGMRVPMTGEVFWILPEGSQPYYRGRITKLAYEFARPA